MLILALICTVLGLALLIAALATGILPLAWACIGICALGFVFLVIDIIKHRKTKSDADADDAVDSAEEDAAEDVAEDIASVDTADVDDAIIED